MNINSFFLDKLAAGDQTAGQTAQKSSNIMMLFADIMKVVEGESAAAQKGGQMFPQTGEEINPASENLINCSQADLAKVSQYIDAFIADSQQPVKIMGSGFSLDTANVGKKQFLLSASGLQDFINGLMQKVGSKNSFKLSTGKSGDKIDADNTDAIVQSLLQSLAANKSLTLSFKKGTDKIQINLAQLPEENVETKMNLDKLTSDFINSGNTAFNSLEKNVAKCAADKKSGSDTADSKSKDASLIPQPQLILPVDVGYKAVVVEIAAVQPGADEKADTTSAVGSAGNGASVPKMGFPLFVNGAFTKAAGAPNITQSEAAAAESQKFTLPSGADPAAGLDALKQLNQITDSSSDAKQLAQFEDFFKSIVNKGVSQAPLGNQKSEVKADDKNTASVNKNAIADAKAILNDVPSPKGKAAGQPIQMPDAVNADNDKKQILNSKAAASKNAQPVQIADAEVSSSTAAERPVPKDEKLKDTQAGNDLKSSSADQNKDSKLTIADLQNGSPDSDANLKHKQTSDNAKNNFAAAINQAGQIDLDKVKPAPEFNLSHETLKSVKPSEIIPEFSKFIQQGDKQSLSFQIMPENLGKIKLTIDMQNNLVNTKIEVENDQVKQFVQSSVGQLKDALNSAGIQMGSVNVSLTSSDQQMGKGNPSRKKSSHPELKITEPENVTDKSQKIMGYNTYEYLA